MAKENEKHDWLLCFLLAIIVVLILIICGGVYLFSIIGNETEIIVEEKQTVEITTFDHIGEWNVIKAVKKSEEVYLSDIYGSSATYGVGKLTLNADGTFTDFIRPVTSSEQPYKGTYVVGDNVIVLMYENSDKQRELIYNSLDNTLRYTEWADYGLILSKIYSQQPKITKEPVQTPNPIATLTPTPNNTPTINTEEAVIPNNTPIVKPEETPIQNIDNSDSAEFWSYFEDKTSIGLYEKNGEWDSYWAPGIEVRYPKDWTIQELGGYERGNRQGEISTIIKGKVKGTRISDDTETLSYVVIKIYEPEYMVCKTDEEYARIKCQQRNIPNYTGIGLEGNLIWKGSGNSKYSEIDKSVFTTYQDNWGHEIDIETDNRDNIQLTNIENNILGSAKARSY